MDSGFRSDEQYGSRRNEERDFASLPSSHDVCEEPFVVVLHKIWMRTIINLSEPTNHLNILHDTQESPYPTILEDFLTHTNRCNFWCHFFNMTQLMVEHRCTNLPLMADWLEVACDICYKVPCKYLIHQLQNSCLSKRKTREYATELEELLYVPYEFAHNEVHTYFDEVKRAATSGNVGLLEVLLKFGVTPLRPRIQEGEEYRYTRNVVTEVFKKNLPIKFIARNLNDIYSDSRRRLFLLMRILDVIPKIRVQPEHAVKYVKSINLLFESIPDPKFTVDEVRRSVERVCTKYVNQQDISLLCEEFMSYFPDSCKPSGPRTLRHLCRFQVRESLRSHMSCFLGGVKSLPLPSHIKRYILLQDEKKLDLTPIMIACGRREI